ncbi:unnamed protein product, partial [Coccothraustes coccothraustes]
PHPWLCVLCARLFVPLCPWLCVPACPRLCVLCVRLCVPVCPWLFVPVCPRLFVPVSQAVKKSQGIALAGTA